MNETKQTKEKSTNYIQYAEGFARFLADCCVEYAVASSRKGKEYPVHPPPPPPLAKPQPHSTQQQEHETKTQQQQQETKDEDNKAIKKSSTATTAAKSAAAVGALTFSLYSTYQASTTWGDVTLQNQVELLLEHVEANLLSARIWTEERQKLNDPIPELVLTDLKRLRQLVDCLYRLDSRREKKIETAGW